MKTFLQQLFRRRARPTGNPNEIFIFYTAFLLVLAGPAAFAQRVTAVSGVSITVEDLDRELEFFTTVLEFKKVDDETWTGEQARRLFGLSDKHAGVRVVTLQLGTEKVRLMDFDGAPSRLVPADTRSNDLWFQHLAIVVSDIDAAYQRLLEHRVTHVSTSPQTLPAYLPNAAGIRAFYFRDPEGHNLELIWFPPGKGNARWQQATGSRLFLGIDHTAIAIADTERSLGFYRDQLHLDIGGHSENYGPEQEHLNQVFGARLDINGLHAGAGFGVEFLRYIAPPGGRVYPAGSNPTDLWHYHTELQTDNLPALIKKLETAGFAKISKGVARLDGREMFLVRDPDGHAVLFWQE